MNSINLSIMLTFAVIGVILQCLFIFVENKKEYVKAVILKGSASLCFLSSGITGFIYSTNKLVTTFILVGLVLGVVGDILLNLRFVIKNKSQLVFLSGTASFLLGHIFYIIALFIVAMNANKELIYVPIIVTLLVAGIVGFFIFNKLTVKVGLKVFGCVYIIIVSLFMAVANYNLFVLKNNFSILTGVGSILFFASDVILIFNSFGPKPRLVFRASNLLLYFIGQVLITFALLF